MKYDQMAWTAILQKPVPGRTNAIDGRRFEPRDVTDTDIGAVQAWLQDAGLRSVTKDSTHQACDMVAEEHGYHRCATTSTASSGTEHRGSASG